MNAVGRYLRELFDGATDGWNRFWFTPADPATLSLVRILAGAMLLYTHLVWTFDLEAFFGAHSWVQREAVETYHRAPNFAASYLWWCEAPAVLWSVHLAALVVLAMLMLGLFTRPMSVLAFVIVVSYANRTPGALFGLDKINAMLAMYLMIGPAGARYSLDRLLRRRRDPQQATTPAPSVAANVAVRLMQVHMCVIYFFAGLSKLQGPSWWDGTALWGAFANLEYQSLDLTWLAQHELVVNLLTHGSVFFELSFCVLIWPRLTRPIVLALAVGLHLGIAFTMGMITFGLVMLIGCTAFVAPDVVRACFERRGAGKPGQSETPARSASEGRKRRKGRTGEAGSSSRGSSS